MWRGIPLLFLFGVIPRVLGDTYCSADVPCEIGCCGKYNVCGMGPDYCGVDNCINNCDAKAECNPGSWPSEYVNATTCPLNVCCSPFGFCGTTEEFCGSKTVTAPSCDASSHSITRVIGYYNSAAATRACDGMAPFAFPQGVFSHIYFAFGSIDPDTFEVIPAEAGDESLYSQLQALQMRDPEQELWLSIGGWDFSDSNSPTATTFSDLVAADSGQQNAFFSSLINFMSSFGFSGVDIDWEYPVAADRNGRPGDYNNYPKFLANLKKALQTYKYGLSITLPTSYWYLQHFDITSIEPSVDWFNFMSYDLHGTWDIGDQWTGPYLDAQTNLTEIKTALDLLWRNNISPSKVNMGMAFYGRTFTLVDPSCSEPGCAYASAGDAGTCSNSAGILFGSEIMDIIQENDLTPTLYKDAAVKTITWNTDQWASYDDEDTWKLKAEFAKSECLGGVLPLVSEEVSPLLGSSNSQDQYCRFINCGEVCPSGFKEVPRADKSGQLMLDSTECRSWTGQTQTLCCPSTEEMPTCQWRGFHNSGKCKGGCESGEAEVGTITAGCHSGYQSACCTVTSSTKPWSQCAWTESCESDETCPSGYNQFVVSSRQGWGGRKSCGSKKHYNYCCSGAVPDAFTNCAWTGHVVEFTNTEYCTDACPSGSIRIAEESINVVFGAQDTAQTANCLYGNEAYCCAGTTHTLVPRYDNPLEDHTLTEFYAYLDRFLAHPVCPPDWDPEYDAGLGFIITRDTSSSNAKSITKNQALVLSNLLLLLQTWLTSSSPSQRFADVWKELTARYGYAEQAANVTLLTSAVNTVAAGNAFTGSADYEVRTLLAQTLCDIAESANGLESLSAASDALCEMPTGVSSSTSTLTRRAIDGGDLSFHYARWIDANPWKGMQQVILELAFWIGPTAGETPSDSLRAQYADASHTFEPDRWIIFHLHIVRDRGTFWRGGNRKPGFFPGVTAMGVYQSQTIHEFPARNGDPRAEFVFSSNYRLGELNSGPMRDYNSRTQTLECRRDRNGQQLRWYIGRDLENAVSGLRDQGRPAGYSEILNQFGLWLIQRGIMSNDNLGLLWPRIRDIPVGNTNGPRTNMNGLSDFDPVANAFNTNFQGSGRPAPDISGTAPTTTKP
ncbi:chitinase [Aspergillus brunneoviolaceus CBS 621.78]|uniref:Glycoside hydrolase n=1 Tax=Aspergillus brunneoviolaceus CBS 621.78 TaxID=1450534 RepID=A0ACD1GE31_9EURO|nr:glycoside hydrolase [Aspergillus brunneoviolaceus CBS 621.78]RAH47433.1 glycoside hydrolase [Aspergillus brunneoviolaceus CBS 621.78]